jgi:hypothetical protein
MIFVLHNGFLVIYGDFWLREVGSRHLQVVISLSKNFNTRRLVLGCPGNGFERVFKLQCNMQIKLIFSGYMKKTVCMNQFIDLQVKYLFNLVRS